MEVLYDQLNLYPIHSYAELSLYLQLTQECGVTQLVLGSRSPNALPVPSRNHGATRAFARMLGDAQSQ